MRTTTTAADEPCRSATPRVVATLIANAISCDVHEIIAAETYSDNYDATVARNVREQNADARPKITNPLASIDQYNTVLLGSPIWNVRPPMIMSTFTDRFDFTGRTVLPLVTFAVSGMGQTEDVYRQACPGATLGEGLAVRGEEATGSQATVENWLQRAGLS